MFRRLKSGRKKDKAIVHQSVPDEVLYPEGKPDVEADMSWLDDVGHGRSVSAAPAPSAPQAPAPQRRTPVTARPTSQPVQRQDAPKPSPAIFQATANAASEGRPSKPVGWLVVVEGNGVGDWFVLEGGVTSIGGSDTQTIRLASEAANADAAIAYDPASHTFAVSASDSTAIRLNGVAISGMRQIRDGDVVTIGGTALRLVALCGPNFQW